MNDKKEKHWEKYRKPKKETSKLCCYLFGLCDLICFTRTLWTPPSPCRVWASGWRFFRAKLA